MAIALSAKVGVDNTDPDFPLGKIVDGVGTGTPITSQSHQDFHQFFAKLLAEAGITANGLLDNDPNGYQYIEALKKLMGYEAWIDFSGSFSASALLGGSVSFPGGSVVYARYRLFGKTLHMQIYLAGFTITGSCPAIVIDRPTASISGYENANFKIPMISNNTAGAYVSLESLSGPAQITIYPVGGGNFSTGTADRVMSINVVAEVT